MIGVFILILVACLAYALVMAITGSGILALVAALIVLLVGLPVGYRTDWTYRRSR